MMQPMINYEYPKKKFMTIRRFIVGIMSAGCLMVCLCSMIFTGAVNSLVSSLRARSSGESALVIPTLDTQAQVDPNVLPTNIAPTLTSTITQAHIEVATRFFNLYNLGAMEEAYQLLSDNQRAATSPAQMTTLWWDAMQQGRYLYQDDTNCIAQTATRIMCQYTIYDTTLHARQPVWMGVEIPAGRITGFFDP
jgi:hypothetical protein